MTTRTARCTSPPASGPAPAPTRVTCDPGIETHPVVNTAGVVAYASDADGDWDIYVSVPPPPILNRPAAFAATSGVAGSGPATGPPAAAISCARLDDDQRDRRSPGHGHGRPLADLDLHAREHRHGDHAHTHRSRVQPRLWRRPARPLPGRGCRRVLEPSARAHEHSGLRRVPAGRDDVRDRRGHRRARRRSPLRPGWRSRRPSSAPREPSPSSPRRIRRTSW